MNDRVKQGDTQVLWRANMDLTGATSVVTALERRATTPVPLPSSIPNPTARVVDFDPSALPVGRYTIHIRFLRGDGETVTFPSDDVATLYVDPYNG